MPAIERVPFTKERFEELATVNKLINREVKYETDIVQFKKPEFWVAAEIAGDCEDFALAKRKKLRSLGWPRGSLDIAMCLTPEGEGHAVLVSHTTNGDYVLDNVHDDVKAWTSLDYKWLFMSQGGSFLPGNWVKIA
jgi:predicted transglutaminase-like cysteine proteinase